MVKDVENLAIAIKYEFVYMGFELVYFNLTWPILKVHVKVMHVSQDFP